MIKRLMWVCVLIMVVSMMPFGALAETASFSVTTDASAQGAVLMDENGTSVSTVLGSQSVNGQTVWTLQVTKSAATTFYLYTRDASGNWINTALSYQSDWIFQPGNTPTVNGKAWSVKEYALTPINIIPLAEDERVQSRCGPSKDYHGAGAYKTYKMTSTDALFTEGRYVLVDLQYTTVGRRRVYFPVSAFSSVRDVPEETLSGVAAYTTSDLIPTFGPGLTYDTFDEAAISSGTTLTVFFEEDSWVFAEFTCDLGVVRAWIPTEQVMAQ